MTTQQRRAFWLMIGLAIGFSLGVVYALAVG